VLQAGLTESTGFLSVTTTPRVEGAVCTAQALQGKDRRDISGTFLRQDRKTDKNGVASWDGPLLNLKKKKATGKITFAVTCTKDGARPSATSSPLPPSS
jgi:hypothetical protein